MEREDTDGDAVRATDLIGIYESDNGRKGEWISTLHVKNWLKY